MMAEDKADKCPVCFAETEYKDTEKWDVWECPNGHGAWLKSKEPYWKEKQI